uniref:Tetratricopeptide repeat domain 9B n=1 Tax=Laticauda laticaudata TaxID=8630 RepID=A0A8C5RNW4_LATLA
MKAGMEEHSLYQKSCPEANGASLVLGMGGGNCRARCATAAELEAKLQRAVEFKVEGHRCYKQKLREAIGKYHRALLQLKGLELLATEGEVDASAGKSSSLLAWRRLSAKQQEQVDSTEMECYDSLTAKTCLLQSELVNYERVREYCLKVLAKEKGNFKAMYCAGIAFYHLGDCDKALLYLKEAKRCQPTGGFLGGLTEMKISRCHQCKKEETA